MLKQCDTLLLRFSQESKKYFRDTTNGDSVASGGIDLLLDKMRFDKFQNWLDHFALPMYHAHVSINYLVGKDYFITNFFHSY